VQLAGDTRELFPDGLGHGDPFDQTLCANGGAAVSGELNAVEAGLARSVADPLDQPVGLGGGVRSAGEVGRVPHDQEDVVTLDRSLRRRRTKTS